LNAGATVPGASGNALISNRRPPAAEPPGPNSMHPFACRVPHLGPHHSNLVLRQPKFLLPAERESRLEHADPGRNNERQGKQLRNEPRGSLRSEPVALFWVTSPPFVCGTVTTAATATRRAKTAVPACGRASDPDAPTIGSMLAAFRAIKTTSMGLEQKSADFCQATSRPPSCSVVRPSRHA